MADQSAQHATLAEPLVIAEWWKNRRGESVRLTLKAFKDIHVVDLRAWWTGDDGVLKPGKGLCLHIRHLPKLAAALNKAVAKAREFGLIDDDDSGGAA